MVTADRGENASRLRLHNCQAGCRDHRVQVWFADGSERTMLYDEYRDLELANLRAVRFLSYFDADPPQPPGEDDEIRVYYPDGTTETMTRAAHRQKLLAWIAPFVHPGDDVQVSCDGMSVRVHRRSPGVIPIGPPWVSIG
ncbi:MAG: hypothetical protein JWM87_765 [Candidatus Eremiobacteraeota bacterium]|nr:hypothetical protein [Candidatus Eremiobacteraeota bacterium]